MVPLLSHDVTKKLMGHRMQIEGPQTKQNRPFDQENGFHEINISKWSFSVSTNLGFHTLVSLGRPAVDSRLTSVVPLRFFGCDGSEEEGGWHENSAHSGCKHFFSFLQRI